MPKDRPTSNRSPHVLTPTLNSNTNYITHTHTHTLQWYWLTTNQDPQCMALVARGAAIVLVVDLRVRRELRMDLLATWSTAVQSARRQALTLRRPDTTIPIYWMTMRFHRSSRGTDNFDETTTALVSTMSIPIGIWWRRRDSGWRRLSGEGAAEVGYSGGQLIRHRGAASVGYSVSKEQQRSSSLMGDPYIAAEQRGAATSTSTLVGDHYVAEKQQGPVASATMSGGGGHRTA